MEDKFTTIAYHTYSRALLLQNQLEAAGIECLLTGINVIQPMVGSGVRLRVKTKDVEVALRIIQESGKMQGKAKTAKKIQQIKKILVPVDFSDYSKNACYYAVALADTFKAEIKLFHAFFKPAINLPTYEGAHLFQMNYDNYFQEIEIKAKKQLQELTEHLEKYIKNKKLEKIKITATASNGFAEDAILEITETYKPGIVVIGSHGIGEKTKGIFGSVAIKLIDKIDVPLMAIPASATFKGLSKINNILYATDFDETDYAAIHRLVNLIRPFDMKLHCVHICIGSKKPWDSVKMDNLRDYIKAEYPDQKAKFSNMLSDNIFTGLETYMRNNNIGIVSFNSHKRNIFTKLFSPSITRKALSRFNKPVFVFRSE